MRNNKLVDLSNPYSPRSRSLLAKGRQILSQLNNTKKFEPKSPRSPRSPSNPKSPTNQKSPSRSKSPGKAKSPSRSKQPIHNKQFVTVIRETQTYQKNNNVILTADRIGQIHDRLAIDHKTEKEFELRVRNDKMYFKANRNPFTQEFQFLGKDEDPPPKVTFERSVLGEMARLRETNQQTPSRRLDPVPTPVKNMWERFKKDRYKEPILPTPQYEVREVHGEEVRLEHIKSAFEEFEELVGQREANFFQQRYMHSDKNIFLLIKDRNHPKFRSNKEVLDMIYFNNDSMVTHGHQKQKYRVNCLQEISSFARLLVKGLKWKNMPDKMVISEADINLKMDKLQLEDVMLIASGKLASSALLKYFREEEEETNKKKRNDEGQPAIQQQKQQKQQISYSESTRNKTTDFNPVDQDKTQIEYYGRSEYTRLQKQQLAISKNLQGKLKRALDEQISSRSYTIKDKRIMAKFHDKKNKTLMQLLNSDADKRIAVLMKKVERKIRMNKVSKNRTEKIKVDILTQSFKMKKHIEGGTNSRSKSKSSRDSSFSPLKTWRV